MPLNIIRNDISKVSADAIVNTANPEVAIGQGVDSAIYEAAGAEKLLAERAKIGPMDPGQAAATPAFDLDAKYIIHTVGPVWQGGGHGEFDAVASCYRESLKLADELGCESVAFPLISTGTYRFPKDEALKIAINEISTFLFGHDMNVYLVVYDKESFVITGKAFSEIKTYIDEAEVVERNYATSNAAGSSMSSFRRNREHWSSYRRRSDAILDQARRKGIVSASRKIDEEAESAIPEPDLDVQECGIENFDEAAVSYSLDIDLWRDGDYLEDTDIGERIGEPSETFQQMLFRIIDRKDLKDSEVYNKANIDRRLFSKIRSNANYQPSKRTALALAIALELNLDETKDLLLRAGYALSPSSKADLIVEYCIKHKIYNIYEINTYLFDYDQPLLAG